MSGRTASAAVFLVLAVAALLLDARGRRAGPAVPAAAALAAAMRTTPGRVIVFAVWLWLGVHFLAR